MTSLSFLTRSSKMALAAALGLSMGVSAMAQESSIVVLKETEDIDYELGGPENSWDTGVTGGDFGDYEQFLGLDGESVVVVHVDDVWLTDNEKAQNHNTGDSERIAANKSSGQLWKWDLSELPGFEGSTVNAAVVRLYQTNGNEKQKLGRVITHDWEEDSVTLGSPEGNELDRDEPGEWGPDADSFFDLEMDSEKKSAKRIHNKGVGEVYTTFDVTEDVQKFADGEPNYGWAGNRANVNFVSSEDEELTGSAPALFIDYTPAQ